MKLYSYTGVLFLSLFSVGLGETIGHWRFEEPAATAGNFIENAVNQVNSSGVLTALPVNGSPLYATDVPAARIFDPISGTIYANSFSFDASGSDAQMGTMDAQELNASFTVEFFVKLTGEPGSFVPFVRRQEAADLSWQMDFDHASTLSFGQMRGRWDTPAGGVPDGVSDGSVDENANFVLTQSGGVVAPKVFVDTGAKDAAGLDVGPQNTGNLLDYIYNAGSANPSEADVSLQGDSVNDDPSWHHAAMSFDENTGEIRLYLDYVLTRTRILPDSEMNGYTHPAAGLVFGKMSGDGFGLFFDEVRYSSAVLSPSDFLRPAAEPASSTSLIHWRMDDSGAAAGSPVSRVLNSISNSFPADLLSGVPLLSEDVPGVFVLDPVTLTTLPNAFSLDVSDAYAQLSTPSNVEFNSSFTIEMFLKIDGEPTGFNPLIRRESASDHRWQVDFDHSAKQSYGRLRSRFDNPGENSNIVVGALGGSNIPASQRIWVDTDAGDGLVTSYDDPDDWFLDGDAFNDTPGWHHLAVTFDEDLGRMSFFYDYELMETKLLQDSLADGYTHPDGSIDFGKFAGSTHALLMDEIRYSTSVLQSYEFLRAVDTPPIPALPLRIVEVNVDQIAGVTLKWNSRSGALYRVEKSPTLAPGGWETVANELDSDGELTTLTLPPGPVIPTKVFYRVIELP